MELVKLSVFKYVTAPLPRDYLSLRRNAILPDVPVSFNSREVPVFTLSPRIRRVSSPPLCRRKSYRKNRSEI